MSYTWSMRENEGKWLLWHFPSSFAGSLGLAWRVFQSVGGVCVCLFFPKPAKHTGAGHGLRLSLCQWNCVCLYMGANEMLSNVPP